MNRKKNKGLRVAISKRLTNQSISPQRIRKAKEKKAKSFEGHNIDEKTAEIGMEGEYNTVNNKNVLFGAGIIIGSVLTILDIRDHGMIFEGFGFKFSGSLVGILIIFLSLYFLSRNNPHVKLSKDKPT